MPAPPPPPPEWLALDLELEEELAEDAEELTDAEAAFPAALTVAVSSGSEAVEAELEAECAALAWADTPEIKGLALDGEDETAEISMMITPFPEDPPSGRRHNLLSVSSAAEMKPSGRVFVVSRFKPADTLTGQGDSRNRLWSNCFPPSCRRILPAWPTK
jgi:hypothetical protein